MAAKQPITLAPFTGIQSWEQLLQTVQQGRVENFSRTPEVGNKYIDYLSTHVPKYASISDCVKVDVLGFNSLVDAEGRIRAVALDEMPAGTVKPATFVKNHFPYAVEAGINHWVLWTLGDHDLSSDEVKVILDAEFGREDEYMFFINPPHRKTVHEAVFCCVSACVRCLARSVYGQNAGRLNSVDVFRGPTLCHSAVSEIILCSKPVVQ
ncbi:hypothetical protein BC830DRAFT_1106675 [Chytriomyces sp. MP71]|nr:hypothetical protein BC830DRAFT_1106675 [Chytriomyces sp. MP71]